MTKLCPLLKSECIEHQCNFYIQLLGSHPQTGVPVSEFDCAIKWLPILLIEGAKETRQAAGAIESFRNEVVAANSRQDLPTISLLPSMPLPQQLGSVKRER